MNRRAVVRHVTLGAVLTGLVPLTAAGAGAGPGGGSAAALCRSTFGERGPAGGPVVGEGPSGDPMPVSLGWEPGDWPGGLRQVVTCLSVDGRGVPALTTVTDTPPNSGSLALSLLLPSGEPGSLVCEQSILVGSGAAEGHTRPTSPICFKLRAADPPPPTRSSGRTSDGAPAPAPASGGPGAPSQGSAAPAPSGPPAPVPSGPPGPGRSGPPSRMPHGPAGPPAREANGPAGPPARTPNGPAGPPAPVPAGQHAAGNRMSSPGPDSTPPARAAFEAAAASTPKSRPTTLVGKPAPALAPAGTPAARPVPGAPATALARTGLDNHIPLAGAGGLLAVGGLSILLGEPRRRSRLRPGV